MAPADRLRNGGGGENCELIHNGFDFDYFSKLIEIEEKNKYCVCMLYHTFEGKGCADAFRALEIVKQRFPQLIVNIFGTAPRPETLPEWYRYWQRPDQQTHNRIYNEAAVFVGPSHSEGFCLTPPEAMMCGCAVACTDIGGYTVCCKHDRTALVSPVRNPERLAENIIRLIEDDDLRYRIAKAGHENIRQFTWESAYDKLKKYLKLR
ncbi:glycosyltransferase family 4 protein [Alistipes putredinis]|uniref:glycosyltransferase family 4 protein n=1 Tax=Alistipes putredinis TaxID=28117 RepID=UPI003AB51ADC